MSGNLPLHVSAEEFDVVDNCICVGGRKITDIVDELGRTPFYVYDGALIKKRIAKLRSFLPSAIKLHYAIKANPMPEVVALVSELVDGLDVASAGELAIALSTPCARHDISMAGPGKSDRDLTDAIVAGITLNVESEFEIERIVAISAGTERRARIAVRVNPDFELKNSGMKMSGGPKQFGIDAERVPDVLRHLAELDIEFCGIHIFSGSQNLRTDAICESQWKAFELAVDLTRHAPRAPEFVNIGGGFGVPYFPGDIALDLVPIRDNLEELLRKKEQSLPETELVLELGRYLVAESGLYICRILDKKTSRGQIFLVTDGGLHHHLAASGNFGQVLRKNYPVMIANKARCSDIEKASVVGPLCTPLDLLADKMDLATADVGDLVAVFQSGAYGFTASPHLFLSHPAPIEILV